MENSASAGIACAVKAQCICAQLVAGAPGALGARPENSFVGLYISLFKPLQARDLPSGWPRPALCRMQFWILCDIMDVSRDGPVFCCDPHLGSQFGQHHGFKEFLASCLPEKLLTTVVLAWTRQRTMLCISLVARSGRKAQCP